MISFRHSKRRIACAGALALLLLAFKPLSADNRVDKEEISDGSIELQIKNELTFDQGVPGDDIHVRVADGVAVLRGDVDHLLAKDRASRVAQTVRGVRSVVNLISVSPLVQMTDDTIAQRIHDALMEDPAADAYEIDVDVRSGQAVLTGTVQSHQEKKLAGIVAKGVSGVRDLTNLIHVTYALSRTDVEIEQDIRQALKWNVHVRFPQLIDIDIDDGVVELNAVVGSAAEKQRIRETAWVSGVRRLDTDGIRVRPWAKEDMHRASRRMSLTDKEIKEAVRDALSQDPRVHMFNVKVAVDDGQVTLQGQVDNLKASRAAMQTARNTWSVTNVINRLDVRPTASILDADIQQRVKHALQRDPYVAAGEVRTTVSSGVVKLTGTVDTVFEKAHIDDVVSRVDGVKFVDNSLQVAQDLHPLAYDPFVDITEPQDFDWNREPKRQPTEPDDVIESRISDELWWSPFVDENEVAVAVNDGVATLTGAVDSWIERQSAHENALEGGALRVINKLQIN